MTDNARFYAWVAAGLAIVALRFGHAPANAHWQHIVTDVLFAGAFGYLIGKKALGSW